MLSCFFDSVTNRQWMLIVVQKEESGPEVVYQKYLTDRKQPSYCCFGVTTGPAAQSVQTILKVLHVAMSVLRFSSLWDETCCTEAGIAWQLQSSQHGYSSRSHSYYKERGAADDTVLQLGTRVGFQTCRKVAQEHIRDAHTGTLHASNYQHHSTWKMYYSKWTNRNLETSMWWDLWLQLLYVSLQLNSFKEFCFKIHLVSYKSLSSFKLVHFQNEWEKINQSILNHRKTICMQKNFLLQEAPGIQNFGNALTQSIFHLLLTGDVISWSFFNHGCCTELPKLRHPQSKCLEARSKSST